MAPAIDAVHVVTSEARNGEDAAFIALHAAGTIGWYGPVGTKIGRYVGAVLAPAVIGVPVNDHQGLQAVLRRATEADADAVASWAAGAVDCAAWDLHGQLDRVPVADLLTVAPRRRVPLYASWLSLDVTGRIPVAAIQRVCLDGWAFTKWGLRGTVAVEHEAEALRLAAAVRAMTATLGQMAAFDAVFTWDVELTRLFLGHLDPASIRWLEDPLPEYDLAAYRALTVSGPLAFGERLLLHADAEAVLGLNPLAFTIDVVACGGLTRAIDLVTTARKLGVPIYPHGRSFVPAIHLAAAYPDAIVAVEYRLRWEPVRQQKYARSWQPTHGMITLPESPGMGATPRSR